MPFYRNSYAIFLTVVYHIQGFVLEFYIWSSRHKGSVKDHRLSSIFSFINWSGYSILVVYRRGYGRVMVTRVVVFGFLRDYLSGGVLGLLVDGLIYFSDSDDSSFHSK